MIMIITHINDLVSHDDFLSHINDLISHNYDLFKSELLS